MASRRSRASAWHRRQESDPHVRAARRAGYRSRAAYKLLELETAYQIFRGKRLAVDLGCAPGSWSQVLADSLGKDGRIVGVDLLAMATIPGVDFVRGDFREEAVRDAVAAQLGAAADLVVSDVAPNLSGVTAVDQSRAEALNHATIDFAEGALRTGGDLLVKVFESATIAEVRARLAANFQRVRAHYPRASRSASREFYLYAAGKKG